MIASEEDLVRKKDCDRCKDNNAKLMEKIDGKIDTIDGKLNSIETKLAVYGEKIKNLEKVYYGLIGAASGAVLYAILKSVFK